MQAAQQAAQQAIEERIAKAQQQEQQGIGHTVPTKTKALEITRAHFELALADAFEKRCFAAP
jgi:hypothetical protein